MAAEQEDSSFRLLLGAAAFNDSARTIKGSTESNFVLREESDTQEGSAIREQRKLGPNVWSLPVSEISARSV